MRVIKGLAKPVRRRRPTVLTLGNFDGVHLGHKAVIAKLARVAREHDAVPTVVTFEPHPQKVLRGEGPTNLVSPERKLELLEEAGVEQVVVLSFTRALSRVEPEKFVEDFLVGGLNAKAIVVGADARFGRFARGDSTMLRSLGRTLGFAFSEARLAELEGRRVSSTEIRHALMARDIEWANRALGRPFGIPGKIVRGHKRGRELGFPTANLRPRAGMCLPGLGIYAGWLVMTKERRPAAISIGTNPTFGDNKVTIEAYVLGFEGSLDGLPVEVQFEAFIRAERAFRTVDGLTREMGRDVQAAADILATRGWSPRRSPR